MDKPVKRIIKAIQTLMQVHGGLANEAELENALNEHIREQVFDVLSLPLQKQQFLSMRCVRCIRKKTYNKTKTG